MDGEVLEPRQPFSTVAYAFQAQQAVAAQRAGDADTVGGLDAAALDQSSHVADAQNPHAVTRVQIGAASEAELQTHSGDGGAHHAKTSSFAELGDQIADGQIPDAITRDDELLPLLREVDGAGSELDADRLDGLTASSFVRSDGSGSVLGNLNVTGRVTAEEIRFDPVVGRAVLPGAAFLLEDGALAADWRRSNSAAWRRSGSGDIRLLAFPRMPDGARMTEFRCYYQDGIQLASLGFTALLQYKTLSGVGGSGGIASVVVDPVIGGKLDVVKSVATAINTNVDPVDNTARYYYVFVVWNQSSNQPQQRFHGCTVTYTFERPGS